MRRFILILVLVFQPLQWGWANVHAAADTAHAVSHDHGHGTATVLEIAPTCDLAHAADGTQACHDHHAHHLTVLGFGPEPQAAPADRAASAVDSAPGDPIRSLSLTRIERPKWFTTTPAVVVNL